MVPMGGRMVNTIRVRVDGNFREERRPPTASEAARAAQKPLDDLDDDIPFAWIGGAAGAVGTDTASGREAWHDRLRASSVSGLSGAVPTRRWAADSWPGAPDQS